MLVPNSSSVLDFITFRDEHGNVNMFLESDLKEAASKPGGGAFSSECAGPESYVDPSFIYFVKVAQVLLDAGLNEPGSAQAVSIIEQMTTSGMNGHFRAWVRDKPPSSELNSLDAQGIVAKVRHPPRHAHALTCTLGGLLHACDSLTHTSTSVLLLLASLYSCFEREGLCPPSQWKRYLSTRAMQRSSQGRRALRQLR